MSGAAITLENVTKHYRLSSRAAHLATLKSALLGGEAKVPAAEIVAALSDVSFEVTRGEAFGIIGRNGSGKSTLLKLISGILKPTSGRISVEGRVSALIELGAGFHPEISGRENVYINGIMLGLTRREIDKRFDRIVEFSGIAPFIDQPVKTYSSGMYVRLGFAVAVSVDPDILIIDEVLAVGDEEFSHKCIATIQEMKYRGVTLLFVTHQLDQVRTLCDRALWLDSGETAALGDPVRVVDAYLQDVSGERDEGDEQEPQPARDEELLEEEERWGSGEILLRHVQLVDHRGRQIIALGASASVIVEMEVDVREPQEDFVFGIGLYHADGTCVYGTNTDLEGWTAESISGAAKVRFEVPSLDLTAGNYRIDAAVHTRSGRAFDYRRGAVRFVVGSRVHDVGIYRPPHSWTFEGDVRIQKSTDEHRNVPAGIAESVKGVEEAAAIEEVKFRKRRKKR